MKALLRLLFLFSISATSFSQGLNEQISGILKQTGKDIPSDQLFIHADRNLIITETLSGFRPMSGIAVQADLKLRVVLFMFSC
jgi:hypothetical protein